MTKKPGKFHGYLLRIHACQIERQLKFKHVNIVL